MSSMRALSWIALGTVAFACSGSAFTSNGDGQGGTNGAAGTDAGGALDRAGRGNGGKDAGSGGKVGTAGGSTAGDFSNGGMIGVAGDLGIAGDLLAGGAPPIAGTTGNAGSSNVAGTGPAPIDEVCPRTMPAQGGRCADGLVCSYTADVRTACRPVAKCDNGKWAIEKPSCETLHACPTLVAGDKCDAGGSKPCMLNATDGVYCVCTGCGNGGACSNEAVWACAAGSGGATCPKLPPNKGQMCSVDAPCGYGSCATGNGVNAICADGVWDWDFLACPLAATP
jgi:hypothetical protein